MMSESVEDGSSLPSGASADDVNRLFKIFLGRMPESRAVVFEKVGVPLGDPCSRVLRQPRIQAGRLSNGSVHPGRCESARCGRSEARCETDRLHPRWRAELGVERSAPARDGGARPRRSGDGAARFDGGAGSPRYVQSGSSTAARPRPPQRPPNLRCRPRTCGPS